MKKTYVHLTLALNIHTVKRIYTFLLIILTFGCNSDRRSNQNTTAPFGLETLKGEIAMNYDNYSVSPIFHPHPYELKLEIDKLDNEVYDFVIKMQLNDGSFYVSPNAKRDFSGKFTVLMSDSSTLKPISILQETPLSIEEYDPHPFVKGKVNWVRENTTYNQKFERTSDNDFLITGMIQFTIEPRCTLEKIPFSIKYSDGEMKVSIDDNC